MVNVVSRANQFILGQNVYTCMVNVVSRANQFILGQNVYTYMVNVVRRAIIKMFILRCECCEQSNFQNVYT